MEALFARLAFMRCATGRVDLSALSDRMNLSLSALAMRLEGSVPFTVEEAVDLMREADDLVLVRWFMDRLKVTKIDLEDGPTHSLH